MRYEGGHLAHSRVVEAGALPTLRQIKSEGWGSDFSFRRSALSFQPTPTGLFRDRCRRSCRQVAKVRLVAIDEEVA